MTFAGDALEHIATHKREMTNKSTGEVYETYVSLFKPHLAVKRRFIRIYSKEMGKFVQILVLDLDAIGLEEAGWKQHGLPKPNLVVFNERSGKCQYHYLLKHPVLEHQAGTYQRVRKFLMTLVPFADDGKSPANFRSPFFIGNRKYSYFLKKDVPQALYAWTIIHEDVVLYVEGRFVIART